MDNNSLMLRILEGMLPEQTAHLLRDHVLAPESPFQIIRRTLTIYLQRALSAAWPFVQPLVTRLADALQDSPDIVFLGAVLTFLFLALQLMLWVHRVVMFWTRLATRLLLWACLAGLPAFLWQRGPEASIRDIVVFVSKVVGYTQFVKDVWLAEYQKWDAQTKNSGKVRVRKVR